MYKLLSLQLWLLYCKQRDAGTTMAKKKLQLLNDVKWHSWPMMFLPIWHTLLSTTLLTAALSIAKWTIWPLFICSVVKLNMFSICRSYLLIYSAHCSQIIVEGMTYFFPYNITWNPLTNFEQIWSRNTPQCVSLLAFLFYG